jgi:hypothetical protein
MNESGLRADSDGYLKGEPIDWADDFLPLVTSIKGDTAQLVRLFRDGAAASRKSAAAVASGRAHASAGPSPNRSAAASMRARDELGRFVAQRTASAVSAVQRGSAAARAHEAAAVAAVAEQTVRSGRRVPRSSAAQAEQAAAAERDARGRFAAGQRPGAGASNEGGFSGAARTLNDAGSSLSQAAAALAEPPDIDPALAAISEAKQAVSATIDTAKAIAEPVLAVAGPLGRGFARIFGRGNPEAVEEKKQTGILRRMLRLMTEGGGRAVAGVGGGIGGLLSLFPNAAGLIGSGVAGLAGGAAGGLLAGAGRLGGRALGGLGRVGGALARRLPIIGPLLAAGIVGADAFDSSLPTAQRRTAGFRAGGTLAGGLGGAALGMAIGTALLPGIGTVVGGIVGAMGLGYVGETIGRVTGESWDKIVSTVSGAWDRGIKAFDQYVIEPGRKAFEVLTEFVMNLPGVQAGRWLANRTGQAIDQARDVGGRAVQGVRTFAGNAADRIGAVMGWNRADAATQQAIREAAAAVGVDPALLATIASKESSLNPSARAGTSSATGLFQFVDRTWLDTIGEHGAKHGINTAGMTREQVLAMRTDPRVSALMGAEFLKANMGKVGSSPQAAYLAHFLGAGGASKVLGAGLNTPIEQLLSAEQIKANSSIFASVRTAGDLQSWAYRSMMNRSGGALGLPAMTMESMLSAKPQALAVPTIPPVVAGGGFDQLNSQKPRSVVLLPARDKASQNVSDRSIAHIATGGIGQ